MPLHRRTGRHPKAASPMADRKPDPAQIVRAFADGQAAVRADEAARRAARPGAAVLIPLLPTDAGYDVLFEVRALHLGRQPGEVCFPGGHRNVGESGQAAAVRETCEELLVQPSQVRVLGALDGDADPKGMPVHVAYGLLSGYAGTWSADEVDRTFTVPLAWFLTHEPQVYTGTSVPVFGDDFPWDAIPGGRAYPWRSPTREVTFYRGTDPLVWGMTARMMHRFTDILKRGGL